MSISISHHQLLPIESDLENWRVLKDIPIGGKFEVDLDGEPGGRDSIRISKGSNRTCVGWAIQSTHRAFNKTWFNTLAEIGPILDWLETFRKKTFTDLSNVSDPVKKE